ncbi:hypothetical protein ACF0H5_020246 [Mactra antiquata]
MATSDLPMDIDIKQEVDLLDVTVSTSCIIDSKPEPQIIDINCIKQEVIDDVDISSLSPQAGLPINIRSIPQHSTPQIHMKSIPVYQNNTFLGYVDPCVRQLTPVGHPVTNSPSSVPVTIQNVQPVQNSSNTRSFQHVDSPVYPVALHKNVNQFVPQPELLPMNQIQQNPVIASNAVPICNLSMFAPFPPQLTNDWLPQQTRFVPFVTASPSLQNPLLCSALSGARPTILPSAMTETSTSIPIHSQGAHIINVNNLVPPTVAVISESANVPICIKSETLSAPEKISTPIDAGKSLTLKEMLEVMSGGYDVMKLVQRGTSDYKRAQQLCAAAKQHGVHGIHKGIPDAFYDSLICLHIPAIETTILQTDIEETLKQIDEDIAMDTQDVMSEESSSILNTNQDDVPGTAMVNTSNETSPISIVNVYSMNRSSQSSIQEDLPVNIRYTTASSTSQNVPSTIFEALDESSASHGNLGNNLNLVGGNTTNTRKPQVLQWRVVKGKSQSPSVSKVSQEVSIPNIISAEVGQEAAVSSMSSARTDAKKAVSSFLAPKMSKKSASIPLPSLSMGKKTAITLLPSVKVGQGAPVSPLLSRKMDAKSAVPSFLSAGQMAAVTSLPSARISQIAAVTSLPSAGVGQIAAVTSLPSAKVGKKAAVTSLPSAKVGKKAAVTSLPSAKVGQIATVTSVTSSKVGQITAVTSLPSAKVGQIAAVTSLPSARISQIAAVTSLPSAGVGQIAAVTSLPSAKVGKKAAVTSLPSAKVGKKAAVTSLPSAKVCQIAAVTSLPSARVGQIAAVTSVTSAGVGQIAAVTSLPSASVDQITAVTSLPSARVGQIAAVTSLPSAWVGQKAAVTSVPSAGVGQIAAVTSVTSARVGQIAAFTSVTSAGVGQIAAATSVTSARVGQIAAGTAVTSAGVGQKAAVTSLPSANVSQNAVVASSPFAISNKKSAGTSLSTSFVSITVPCSKSNILIVTRPNPPVVSRPSSNSGANTVPQTVNNGKVSHSIKITTNTVKGKKTSPVECTESRNNSLFTPQISISELTAESQRWAALGKVVIGKAVELAMSWIREIKSLDTMDGRAINVNHDYVQLDVLPKWNKRILYLEEFRRKIEVLCKKRRERIDANINCCHLCCYIDVSNQTSPMEHIAMNHAGENSTLQVKPFYICTHCMTSYTSYNALRLHEIRNHLSSFPCYFCGVPTETVPALINHICFSHCEFFQCNKCSKRYLGKSDVLQHYKTGCTLVPQLVVYICVFCCRFLHHIDSLFSHIQLCHMNQTAIPNEFEQFCLSCRHVFFDERALKVHKQGGLLPNHLPLHSLNVSKLLRLQKLATVIQPPETNEVDENKYSSHWPWWKNYVARYGLSLHMVEAKNKRVVYHYRDLISTCEVTEDVVNQLSLVPQVIDILIRITYETFPQIQKFGTLQMTEHVKDMVKTASLSAIFINYTKTKHFHNKIRVCSIDPDGFLKDQSCDIVVKSVSYKYPYYKYAECLSLDRMYSDVKSMVVSGLLQLIFAEFKFLSPSLCLESEDFLGMFVAASRTPMFASVVNSFNISIPSSLDDHLSSMIQSFLCRCCLREIDIGGYQLLAQFAQISLCKKPTKPSPSNAQTFHTVYKDATVEWLMLEQMFDLKYWSNKYGLKDLEKCYGYLSMHQNENKKVTNKQVVKLCTTEEEDTASVHLHVDEKENTKSDDDEDNTRTDNDEENIRIDNDEDNTRTDNGEDNTRTDNDEENIRTDNNEDNTRTDNDEENIRTDNDEENIRTDNDEENTKNAGPLFLNKALPLYNFNEGHMEKYVDGYKCVTFTTSDKIVLWSSSDSINISKLSPSGDSLNTDNLRPGSDSIYTNKLIPGNDSMSTNELVSGVELINANASRPNDDFMNTKESRQNSDSVNTQETRPGSDSMNMEELRPNSDLMNTEESRPNSDLMNTEESRQNSDSLNTEKSRPGSESMNTEESRPNSDPKNTGESRQNSDSLNTDESKLNRDSLNTDDLRPTCWSTNESESGPFNDSYVIPDISPDEKLELRSKWKALYVHIENFNREIQMTTSLGTDYLTFPIHCYLCAETYDGVDEVYKHIINEHIDSKHEADFVGQFRCTHCFEVLPDFDSLKKHEVEEHLCEFPCYFCGKGTQSCKDMLKHVCLYHSMLYVCFSCGFQSLGIENFIEHRNKQQHFDEKTSNIFECLYCSVCFFSTADLKEHMSQYHIDVPMPNKEECICYSCRHVFMDSHALSAHRNTSKNKEVVHNVNYTLLKSIRTRCIRYTDQKNSTKSTSSKFEYWCQQPFSTDKSYGLRTVNYDGRDISYPYGEILASCLVGQPRKFGPSDLCRILDKLVEMVLYNFKVVICQNRLSLTRRLGAILRTVLFSEAFVEYLDNFRMKFGIVSCCTESRYVKMSSVKMRGSTFNYPVRKMDQFCNFANFPEEIKPYVINGLLRLIFAEIPHIVPNVCENSTAFWDMMMIASRTPIFTDILKSVNDGQHISLPEPHDYIGTIVQFFDKCLRSNSKFFRFDVWKHVISEINMTSFLKHKSSDTSVDMNGSTAVNADKSIEGSKVESKNNKTVSVVSIAPKIGNGIDDDQTERDGANNHNEPGRGKTKGIESSGNSFESSTKKNLTLSIKHGDTTESINLDKSDRVGLKVPKEKRKRSHKLQKYMESMKQSILVQQIFDIKYWSCVKGMALEYKSLLDEMLMLATNGPSENKTEARSSTKDISLVNPEHDLDSTVRATDGLEDKTKSSSGADNSLVNSEHAFDNADIATDGFSEEETVSSPVNDNSMINVESGVENAGSVNVNMDNVSAEPEYTVIVSEETETEPHSSMEHKEICVTTEELPQFEDVEMTGDDTEAVDLEEIQPVYKLDITSTDNGEACFIVKKNTPTVPCEQEALKNTVKKRRNNKTSKEEVFRTSHSYQDEFILQQIGNDKHLDGMKSSLKNRKRKSISATEYLPSCIKKSRLVKCSVVILERPKLIVEYDQSEGVDDDVVSDSAKPLLELDESILKVLGNESLEVNKLFESDEDS